MMKDQRLPPDHHLVRHVPSARLDKDENNNIRGILGAAFRPQEADKNELSTTWLEYFEGSRSDQIKNAVFAIRASRKVGKNHGFAIGNIGAIFETCRKRKHTVRIVHDPDENNKAHSCIKYMPESDLELLEILARESWSELVLNTSVEPMDGKAHAPEDPCPKAAAALAA